ncbi:chaperone protein DnaK [Novimethylophilus kurashikiensis]|uniref:Chaperone protein DnaK n=1 Tax=Novimethylophilus kurashikiensis TaxID=1825523 RepID=A0A2R5F8J0_9PROT|nr:YkgJ family cysteine cluster protein [Novimethylophilus kurashikiensis]GBG14562.1 chaperone protein DnaK [Novimethylophilus kurashikiensis]
MSEQNTQEPYDDFPYSEFADSNYHAAVAAHPWLAQPVMRAMLHKLANENASVPTRQRKVIRLAQEASEAVAPYTACKKGCSSCCHLPLMIFTSEAETIAAITGRKMTHLPFRMPEPEDKVEKMAFLGQPCPFLVENECSIYESRPLECRLHHNMAGDPALCDTTKFGETSIPTMGSFKDFEMVFAWLSLKKMETLADIREFFPE